MAAELLAAGHLYESHSTAEDVDARHLAAGRDPKLGYDNHDRAPDAALHRGRARRPVGSRCSGCGCRTGTSPWTTSSAARSPSRPGSVPDSVLVRGNGEPLYTLVNPVDDALMGITHVLRGEDLLPVHPAADRAVRGADRHRPGRRALPRFGHLPFVTGEGNRKLSKRDPQSNLFHYRDDGFLPEGMVNYLALLGWSIGEDRDIFTPGRAGRGLRRHPGHRQPGPVRPEEGRGDQRRAHLRLLDRRDDFAGRLERLPAVAARTMLPGRARRRRADRRWSRAAAPLVQERSALLSDAAAMLGFLFVDDERFEIDPAAAAQGAHAAARGAGAGGRDRRPSDAAAPTSPRRRLEEALKAALVDGLGLKPRLAFAPVRVAVTGRTVSPPLYESMELLGRDTSLARLRAALAVVEGG